MNEPQPTKSIKAEILVSLSLECVYAWRRNGEWLYIGCSCNALSRISSHHVIGVVDEVRPDDDLEFWAFQDAMEALAYEKHMIVKYRPKFNVEYLVRRPISGKAEPRNCLKCGVLFTPARWWQKRCPEHVV